MGSGPVHSLRRLNDSTPAGPGSGFSIVGGSSTSLYNNSTAKATGLSGNPISLVPFRPNTSVQPWMYVGDSSLTCATVSPAFNCAGMLKVRSDGLTRKTGIAEPQVAPTTSFPGGGSGPSQIFYYYVYRASETGALSNPSPVSIPGTNSQSSPSATEQAASGGVINSNITVNTAQYEGNGTQIRTAGPVPPSTITDYIVARFPGGFTIPSNVTIDGIQIDLNWQGQNAGTGVLSGAQLYYLGSPIGSVKLPGIQNQSFATDTLQGGNGDTWGASLTPDIINDPTFGFGIQITTQSSGGSNRSFINFMKIIVFYSTQDANITPAASLDPQVDKIDFYRQGGGLANPTYVGTGPNSTAVFNDQLSDLAAATNPELQFDNFEPFPSIDLPRSGVINVTSSVLTYVSGDHFNIRWLPGTIMLIGASTQLAFSATRRPSSTTNWDFTNNDPTVVPIADGTNLVWNIAEPILAAQPLPSLWGPTDNTAYMFGCFDPLRPGTLYYTKGNNPDSAPDTNQIEVTSPSEPLMNGVIVNGIGMVFSTERAWLIYPTFTTALATVTGVQGQAFNLQESITDRGLYIRPAICTEAGKRVFFRAKDGIYVSVGGSGSQSITDPTIYNLFPHEGHTPVAITIAGQIISPPDDTLPEKQKLRFATGYLYYDYVGLDAQPHTLVYDVAAGGWIIDTYQHPVATHALEEGPNVNGVYVGCTDGTVRNLATGGSETGVSSIVATGSNTFGDARAFQRIGDIFIKALVAAGHPITLSIYTNQYQTQQTSGFSPTSLAGTGTLLPYIIDFTAGGGLDANDIATVYSWDTNSANYLDLWQPDIIDLPETTQDRVTDWGDTGGTGTMWVKGLLLEADTFNVSKALSIEDELGNFHIPDQSPITLNGQQKVVLSFSTPFITHLARIVTTDGVPWRVWGYTWVSEPYAELVDDFVPPFDNLGSEDAKFIQGFLLEADTNNVAKALTVQSGDDLSFHIPDQSPAIFNGKSIKAFTFTPPFVAHSLRLLAANSVVWRRFSLKWVYQPYPEAAPIWQTEASTFGLKGYAHAFQINLAYICTAAVVVTLVTDQGNFVVNFPAAGGGFSPAKILVKVPRNKWKVCAFVITSTAPLRIWKELCEVWLKQWDSQDAYTKAPIFGGESTSEAPI